LCLNRPFKLELKTLTKEELANVLDFTVEYHTDVSRWLEQPTGVEDFADLTESHPRSYTSWLSFDDSGPELKSKGFSFGQDGSRLILTREERQRSSKTDDAHVLELHKPGDGEPNGHADNVLTGNRDENNSISPQKTLESVDQILHQHDKNQPQGAPRSTNTFPHASDESFNAARRCVSCSNHPVLRTASPCAQIIGRRHDATTRSPLPFAESRTISGSPPVDSPIPMRPLGATGFALLRGKRVNGHDSQVTRVEDEIRLPEPNPETAPPAIPEGFYDHGTLSLPCPFTPPIAIHRYLSSLGLVQKQALVRCLRAQPCLVDLVEDDNLSDVDLILDPHSAVLFISLPFLPSQCDSLVAKLCQLSWRYSQLLVVFEAYSTSRSHLPDDGRSDALKISYYSPPALKAVKKLRRNLAVSEACDTKNSACGIYLAFADSVNEAGMFARYFGDLVEASAIHPAIWGDREWLEGAMNEYEVDTLSESLV
jgi:hypothetical protein